MGKRQVYRQIQVMISAVSQRQIAIEDYVLVRLLVFMITDLLEITQTGEFEDCGLLHLVAVKIQETRLRLTFKLFSGLDEEDGQRWVVRCADVRAHSVTLGNAYDFELHTNHVLLWDYQKRKIAVSFRGATEQPLAVIGRLYATHMATAQEWIPFTRYLNCAERFEYLIAGGYGLLAEGPEPLLLAYQVVLKECGFQTSIREIWSPESPGGAPQVGLLTFGESYIVASQFDADRVSTGVNNHH